MPPKITKVRFSRTSFAAVGTHNAIVKLRENISRYIDSWRTKEIVISRNLPQKRIQIFDMYHYIERQNKVDRNFPIYFFFYVALVGSYALSFLLYDNDTRYYFYIRFPRQMKIFDQICDDLSRKINYYDEKFLKPFELEDVSTVSGYYNYKKKVKNYIFGTDAKKQKEKENIEILNANVQDFNSQIQQLDQYMQNQDEKLHSIVNNQIRSQNQ